MSKASRKDAPSKASSARIQAWKCLEAVRTRKAFANDVIDKMVDRSSLSASDRAFATRLVLGVVSMRGTLDFVLNACMRTPKDVQPDVRDALRLSTYEILYLDKSPHAAVDQGVELVRYVQPKAAGVANAVLHKVVKAKSTFPYADPDQSIEAFALLQGFPPWLAEMLVAELGLQAARQFMAASNEPAPVYLAINPLKGDADETIRAIADLGAGVEAVTVEGIDVACCVRIDNAKVLADRRFKHLVDEGRVLVSDAAAQAIAQLACMAVARACNAESLSCLELCAGRGTKTILLQRDIFLETGRQFAPYVALDNIAFKTKLLSERAATYGVCVTDALCADLLEPIEELKGQAFHLVFLDSPCSGLGTLRRHPEIRWRITPQVIEEDAARDSRLIAAAAGFVAPGGVLVYSTCTVTNEENARVVRAFLESKEGHDFALMPIQGAPVFATHLKPGGCDGHFCAIMCRKG